MKSSILFTLAFLFITFHSVQALEPEVIVDVVPEQYPLYEDKIEAMILQERALVPLREAAEKLGYHIEWNGEERKVFVQKDNTEIVLFIDSTEALVNGERKSLDVPPILIDNRTYAPIRFLAEETNYNVHYSRRYVQFGYAPEVFVTFYTMVPDEEWEIIYHDSDNYSQQGCDEMPSSYCYQSLNAQGQTVRNIRIGSSLAEVKKAYGIPRNKSIDEHGSGTLAYAGPFTPQSGDFNEMQFHFENGIVIEHIVPYGN
ncbi:copper amine oxidase N-terminal domain-containing protein [Heliorestis convoluta]|uniref:copper amine oxidase N-terminal domain-containing protein n=1 Tax=Heliorestis convoluta TaxID=356322 RepID=UPI001FA9A940|nr:copper amine oxidase N-terminal domain-containing protein [Heliorestis convoluta]